MSLIQNIFENYPRATLALMISICILYAYHEPKEFIEGVICNLFHDDDTCYISSLL